MAIKGDLAQIYAGCPVRIKECNIAITQPKIYDICAFGEDNFLMAVQTFTDTARIVSPVKEGNSQLAMLEDFQVLMVILDEDKDFQKNVKSFFEMIFPDYTVRFDPGSICFFTEESENRIIGQINPMNFEIFEKILGEIFLPQGTKTSEDYNPANEIAAKIAEKLKKGNQLRQQMALEEGKDGGSLFSNYISILSVGLAIPVQSLFNYTPFQLYDAFIRYTKKISFDMYQKVATTPMMDVSKMTEPDNWMDNLY